MRENENIRLTFSGAESQFWIFSSHFLWKNRCDQKWMKIGTKVNSRSLILNLLSIFENFVTISRYVALKVEQIANICGIIIKHTLIIKLAQNYGKMCWKPNFTSLNSNLLSHFENSVTICLCVALKVEHIANTLSKGERSSKWLKITGKYALNIIWRP